MTQIHPVSPTNCSAPRFGGEDFNEVTNVRVLKPRIEGIEQTTTGSGRLLKPRILTEEQIKETPRYKWGVTIQAALRRDWPSFRQNLKSAIKSL
jgi:hypothetical protein